MSTQVVRPAGAGHETLWVLLASACVLVAAALLIGARTPPQAAAALAPHQIDARTQLNAAEQGVHADLLVAADEIAALFAPGQALPGVERLREMVLPPFAAGVSADARGAHVWGASQHGGQAVYVGLSAVPEVAASFLLRLPLAPAGQGHGHDPHDATQVWVNRERIREAPSQIDDAALARQGWRQVVVRYDAGVTRRDVAH